MSFDPSKVQLPPPGVELRLPPPNLRELSAEEKYQQVRRQLKDDESSADAMSVQMKTQVRQARAHASSVRVAG